MQTEVAKSRPSARLVGVFKPPRWVRRDACYMERFEKGFHVRSKPAPISRLAGDMTDETASQPIEKQAGCSFVEPQARGKLDEQRASFVTELRSLVQEAGNKPADPAGIAGALHHGWMVLKGVLTGHSEHQILEETERGEDLSLRHYREALSTALPAELKSIVERQYREVQQAHDRIKACGTKPAVRR